MHTVAPLTPPLTPSSPFTSARPSASRARARSPRASAVPSTPEDSPDFLSLPPPIELVLGGSMGMPELNLPGAMFSDSMVQELEDTEDMVSEQLEQYRWRADMSQKEKDEREERLMAGRGRSGLRIVIVTENFLPKVDGVTRTLARLLEHLRKEGHECMLLGPTSDRETYAGHPLVGTTGVPLVVYPGLKLNFLRPKFLRTIRDFQPDVVHFVDPIWLGAQTLMAMELGWAGEDWVAEDGPALGAGITGAVVASYHTNLATYATLFGMSWLEPIMWRLQRWLYSKTLLTLCPSPSTQAMLEAQSFSGVRLWPRGVDVSHFGPNKRSVQMRARWGVGNALAHAGVAVTSKATFSSTNIGVDVGVSVSAPKTQDAGVHYQGRKTSLPLTPPATPLVAAVGQTQAPDRALPTTNSPLPIPLPSYAAVGLPDRVVLLYVGRISWEKNLHLLLAAYAHLPNLLPAGSGLPKLVFVGDGPARTELESLCGKRGWDAEFMGYQSGEMLAECYASGDVFAFPSFTETFGQVVLEALASGLPVVGLDAEGTRDLVKMGETGLLLSLPAAAPSWPTACRPGSPYFELTARGYAGLLARAVLDHNGRREMSVKAATEGVKGFTWWDAMERCVDGYRESLRLAREKRKVDVVCHEVEEGSSSLQTPSSRRVSRVNRVVSRRLAKGPWDSDDTSERLWHLKNVLKAFVAIWMFWAIYSRHHMSLRSVEVDH